MLDFCGLFRKMTCMFKRLNLVLLAAIACWFAGCKSVPLVNRGAFSRFVGVENFSGFTRTRNEDGSVVLLSSEVKARIWWDQLIVSWNADAPAGTFVKLEASAISAGRRTKFYTLGIWSPDGKIFPRTSVSGQRDAAGSVATDTLVLTRLADAAQIRVTLGGRNGALPALKFLGLVFANTTVPPAAHPPNRAAWGKIIPTPERSQHGYPDANGWCSPTSLSMVLARWAEVLHRPEMNLAVPQVAAAVYDPAFAGTGNWPFNTALAGRFPGMRSYVTRLDDLSEVEDWIAAGIPVILSTRWDWLKPGRPFDPEGHLVVCIGFTKTGDVVVNDPATRLDRGESVRHVYRRADVIQAWTQSHNTVYLVYPVGAKIPPDPFGHWEK